MNHAYIQAVTPVLNPAPFYSCAIIHLMSCLSFTSLPSFHRAPSKILRSLRLQLQIIGYNSDLYQNMSDASSKANGLAGIALLIQVRIQPLFPITSLFVCNLSSVCARPFFTQPVSLTTLLQSVCTAYYSKSWFMVHHTRQYKAADCDYPALARQLLSHAGCFAVRHSNQK